MACAIQIRTFTHGLKYTKQDPYQCKKCNTTFPPKAVLMNYFKTLIEEKSCQSSIYDKPLQQILIFVSHLIKHTTEKSFQNDLSEPNEDNFTPEKDDSDHIDNTSLTKLPSLDKYYCKECGKGFSSKKVIDKHLRTHTGLRPYKCNTCNEAFNSNVALRRHCIIHTGERKHKCSICDKTFWWSDNLKKHLKAHIVNKNRPFECDLCSKTFIVSHELTRHKRRHPGLKPYLCTHCGKSVTNLTSHMKMHTEEKLYKCKHCDYACKTNQCLSVHLETHSVDRKNLYQCDACSKTCYTKSGLRSHKNTHTGEKPHKCRHCDMSFVSNANCARHERKHTGEKPFKCSQCSKHFSRPTTCCQGLPNIRVTEQTKMVVTPCMPISSPPEKYDPSDLFI